ncbi:flagellar basal body P-ring protein FlgI [Deferribacterales bacterium RsTz2092]|nr:flagellar P-ring protein [Deferribacterales bacterium]
MKHLKLLLIMSYVVIFATDALAVVKIRDMVNVEGIRDNQIVGYGLVVGLNGTGDKNQTKFTGRSLVNMLERIGITVDENTVKVKNVAAVMVTASLPPFAKPGQNIDVTISSIGDAKSIEGGTLVLTPLSAPNGQVYAVAQGSVSVGGQGNTGGTAGGTGKKSHLTSGRIPNGAVVERDIPFKMNTDKIELSFNKYSLADVVNVKTTINKFIGSEVASITSPSNVSVKLPADGLKGSSYYDFLNSLLNLEIQPETFAKVILDERTGTIVMGSDVRISTVAISHGSLNITIADGVRIDRTQDVSAPSAEEATEENPNPALPEPNKQRDNRVMMLPDGVSVSDLVKALNAIGVGAGELMAILQSIKAAGALHADIQVI